MNYIYEFMVQAIPVPDNRSSTNMAQEYAPLARDMLNLVTALTEKIGGEVEILSHSQIVVRDQLLTTFLIRRPKPTRSRNGA